MYFELFKKIALVPHSRFFNSDIIAVFHFFSTTKFLWLQKFKTTPTRNLTHILSLYYYAKLWLLLFCGRSPGYGPVITAISQRILFFYLFKPTTEI